MTYLQQMDLLEAHRAILNFIEQYGEIEIGDPVNGPEGVFAVTRLQIGELVKKDWITLKKTHSWQPMSWTMTPKGIDVLSYGQAA